MTALSLKKICKSFGKHPVLQDIDLDVGEKEFVILVGPSGCGKSTLLHIMAGLEDVSSGQVWMSGKNITHASPKDRNMAMVFQTYALYPNMTVRENISFGLKLRHLPKEHIEKKLNEVAKILQIETLLDRKPSQLSGGQRQRVAMGRAIARDPMIYLFDEPLSNLDAQLRTTMRKEIKKLHQRIQCAVVYVTHDQQEAMTLGDRIAIMKDGRIEQIGTPSQVYRDPVNVFVAGFIGSPSTNFLEVVVKGSKENPFITFSSDLSCADVSAPKTLGSYVDQKIIVGIRPESFNLSSKPKGDQSLEISPFLTENTGSDEFEHFRLNEHEVVARSRQLLEIQTKKFISIDLSSAFFFNLDTQERIR